MITIDDREIIIRRMMRTDIDAVLALNRKISPEQSTINYRDLLVNDPGRPLHFSFICEYRGMIIGFILARLEYHGIPLVGTCVIKGIAVNPDYRKHGIGSKLVNKLLDCCYTEGVPKVRALIYEGETDLSQFFQRLSFKRSKVVNYDSTFDYLPSESGARDM